MARHKTVRYVNPQTVQQYHLVMDTPYGTQVISKRATPGIQNASKRLRKYVDITVHSQQIIRINDACYMLRDDNDPKEEWVSWVYLQEAHTI